MAEKKVVLAIDDNIQQLNEFKSILVPQYDLRVVKSASEAIAYLNRNASDIILLDIEMPNVSGFDFLGDVRKIPSYFYTPIIIISGNSGHEFMEKAKKSSAIDVITKPFKSDLLVECIERALSAQQAKQ
jgi:PleD family two-component response regulator